MLTHLLKETIEQQSYLVKDTASVWELIANDSKKDSYCFSFRVEKEVLCVSFLVKDFLNSDEESKKMATSMHEALLKQLILEAKKGKLAAIYFQTTEVSEELMGKIGFVKKEVCEKEVLEVLQQKNFTGYVYLIDKEKLKLFIEMKRKLINRLKKQYKKDPTFQYEKKQSIKKDDHVTTTTEVWRYYCDGYEGQLKFIYKNGCYYLREIVQEEDYLLVKKEDVVAVLDELIKKAINRTRVRNLTEPPNKYFNLFFEKEREEYRKLIHQLLLRHYSYKEIETIAVKQKRANWRKIEGLNCLVFGTHYLMQVQIKNTNKVYLFKSKEDLSVAIEHILNKQTKRKVENFFESFD